MAEQDQQFLTEQPIKFLTLLPARKLQSIQFSLDKLQKLYESVKCAICLELLSNPVYLKCSHRFCKDCIQKFIRTNEKKSCPNCRGELSTRRDLRQDYILTTIINYAFGDITNLRDKIAKAEKQIEGCQKGFNTIPPEILEKRQSQKFGSSKKNQMNRSTSQSKRERPANQDQQFIKQEVNLRKKQTYTNENDDCLVKSQIRIELIKNESSLSSKNKKQEVIQISSSDLDQNQACVQIIEKPVNSTIQQEKSLYGAIQKPQNSVDSQRPGKTPKPESKTNRNNEQESIDASMSLSKPAKSKKKKQQTKLEKEIMSLRSSKAADVYNQTIVPDNGPVRRSMRLRSSIQQTKQIKKTQNKQGEKEFQQQSDQNISLDKEAETARSLLMEEFKEGYLYKLFEHCSERYMMKIQLKKLPRNYLTPNLQQKWLYISIKSQLVDISRIIANKLNIDNYQIISFFVQKQIKGQASQENSSNKTTQKYQELPDPKKTLIDLNQTHWKFNTGISKFSLGAMKHFLAQQNQNNQEKFHRVLFYSIKRDLLYAKK